LTPIYDLRLYDLRFVTCAFMTCAFMTCAARGGVAGNTTQKENQKWERS
jgi:hypothetical protein